MEHIIVVQARTNSSRLPGKVLMPINGIPIAALAALRASNTGIPVIVATSIESSDDVLCNVLSNHKLTVFRGDLNNTLNRFVSALEEYSDDTIVFRLTADNIVPDGSLLDEMEAYFLSNKLNYLSCGGEISGLPYGVSVEITYLKHLREAATNAKTEYDTEHVTPYIIRKHGRNEFPTYKTVNLWMYRCTIDCLDDYLFMQGVFSDLDAMNHTFIDIVKVIERKDTMLVGKKPALKLVVGGAQLGLCYGIANTSGMPSENLAAKIIKSSISNGSKYIDTARSYGVSERIIGDVLSSGWQGRSKVITKLSPLDDEGGKDNILNKTDLSVFTSLVELRMRKLDILMLHRASHLTDYEGAILKRLLGLKSRNIIGEIGVSIQNPDELLIALSFDCISYIQMPVNVLEWRFDRVVDDIIKAKKKRAITIHARSSMLQGLLASKSNELWLSANSDNPCEVLDWLEVTAKTLNCSDVSEFCLRYVNSIGWIDGVTVGMETREQVESNITSLSKPFFDDDDMEMIISSRPYVKESVLNPALWNR